MRLLLDTHIFIWACVEPRRLSGAEREAISSSDNDVFVSAASAWEIAIKRTLGRLEFPVERFEEFVAAMSFEPLPMMSTHAIAAGGLPRHHDDPFDRMLIAQTKVEGATIVTQDRKFSMYDVSIFGTSGK
ncbi:MAG TPA: type II toxin-antitoxin system VapC family toxin [Stellaceae bacterium]|nr:type II toxin-antitoxin system VapC family toxin [Stellaceae bacterium]